MRDFFRGGISVYIAVISYLIINLFFGPGGIISYNELKEYRNTLEKNISELQDINRSLVLDSERLIEDSEEIRVIARELGWFKQNEGIILVKGFRNNKTGYSMGRILSREISKKDSETAYRLISLLIALSFYLVTGFMFRKDGRTGIV